MRKISRPFSNAVALFTALAALAGAAACNPSRHRDQKATLRTAISDDLKSLDPALAYDTLTWNVVPALHETLFQYSYLRASYRIEPLLAADMPTFSPDRKTVTIHIRRGVRFHDDAAFVATQGKGRELTAHDFVFALKRLADPRLHSPGAWVLEGKISGYSEFKAKLAKVAAKAKSTTPAKTSSGKSGADASPRQRPNEETAKAFEAPVDGLRALSSHTLQLKLTRPYPQLLNVLALPITAPVAREVVDAYGDENGAVHEKTVGTGPFMLARWDRGREIVLKRHSNYHPEFYPNEGDDIFRSNGLLKDAGKPLPMLDEVVFTVQKEARPSWASFMKGALDVVGIPKEELEDVGIAAKLGKKSITIHGEMGHSFFYLSFNMNDPIVGRSKALRQAISSAIDRDAMARLLAGSVSVHDAKATSALPPGIAGRPEGAAILYDFNPERAKKLLVQAGHAGGAGLPSLRIDMRSADGLARQLGENLVAKLEAVGVKATVVYNTFPAYLEKVRKGNFQIALAGWTLDYPDAENVYQLLYGPNRSPGPNDSAFDHPEMNRLYESMASLPDGPERAAAIQAMDAILQDECPWALLLYRANHRAAHGWVKNFRASPFIWNGLKYYDVDLNERDSLSAALK